MAMMTYGCHDRQYQADVSCSPCGNRKTGIFTVVNGETHELVCAFFVQGGVGVLAVPNIPGSREHGSLKTAT